jgi:hypothetical protein
LLFAALLATVSQPLLAQGLQDGKTVGADAKADSAEAERSQNQRPLFLSTDLGLQFTPPPTFIRSVMAARVLTNGRNLECVITR